MSGKGRALLAVGSGVAVAALGGWLGQRLGMNHTTAGLGAALGMVVGAFAPAITSSFIARRADALVASHRSELPYPVDGPSRLLDPRRGVVGFLGRHKELSELITWCADNDRSKVRLITGPAGVGKTRLALQLAEQLRELDWRCEFVGSGQERSVVGDIRTVWSGRLLLIIDYAETRTDLAEFMRSVVIDAGLSLRVLLLARSAGQWWEVLSAAEPAVRELLASRTSGGNQLSTSLAAEISVETITDHAVKAYAAELDAAPPPHVPAWGPSTGVSVLEVLAFALLTVLDSIDPAIPRSTHYGGPQDVLKEFLGHEERYWIGSARAIGLLDGPDGLTPRMLRQIVAAACLLRAQSEEDALDILARVPGVPRSLKIAHWLHELYPPLTEDQGWLGILEPDLLAEFHVITELNGSEQLARQCLTQLNELQARSALILLGRASSAGGSAAGMLRKLLPMLGSVIETLDASYDVLTSIADVIPYPTIAFAEAKARINEKIIAMAPASVSPGERAARLHAAALANAEVDQYAQAEILQRRAVATWRELDDNSPGEYKLELAGSLVNLGLFLSGVGLWDEAVTANQEAVQILRVEAEADPANYPDLATALNNCATRLADVGRSHDALAAESEALVIRRAMADLEAEDMADLDSDEFARDLAVSLANIGNQLSDVGRWREAVSASEEAVAILRRLASTDPDRNLDSLATCLNSLARHLREQGQGNAALRAGEEALDLRRHLAQTYPDRFTADVAASLNNLSIDYAADGQIERAYQLAKEAVEIRRTLTALDPERFSEYLASSLVNLGIWLSELERFTEALPLAEEGANLYRELAERFPARYRSNLARAWGNLGVLYSDLDRIADAIETERKVLDIFRELKEENPLGYGPEYTRALGNLGNRLWSAGLVAEAIAVAREAVHVLRDLAGVDSERYEDTLAATLRALGSWLHDAGDLSEALDAEQEAVRIYRQLAEDRTEAKDELAAALMNLSHIYSSLGNDSASAECLEEAETLMSE